MSLHEKRKQLKKKLHDQCLRFVGSFSPLVSRLIEQKGFDGIYISGSVISNLKGWPDIGLTTLTEVINYGKEIADFSSLPCIIDVDTGFGGGNILLRLMYELEKKGFSGCHVEDQMIENKKCGHLDKKTILSVSQMSSKIKSLVKYRKDKNFLIIARTDARETEGIHSAIERAKAYVQAGADMIFPEALHSIKEFEKFRSTISVPLMANMTEFGKTDIIPYKTFKNMGYNMVIYPVSTWRLALKAVDEGLHLLFKDRQQEMLSKMQKRKTLYKLLKYKI